MSWRWSGGHYQSSRQEADTATLTLCPTLACNFACDYCFQGVHKPTETMSGEVQDAVLRLFERIRTTHRNLRLLHVAWYGGEPLQRVSVVKDLSDKLLAACREQGINYVASMVSNGFFLTREVAQALAQRGLSLVQITIDGPEDVHDARRHLKSRRGSYANIISNIQSWIREVPLQVQIRVNIDERNKAELFRLIDDLAAAGLGHLPNFKLYLPRSSR